MSQTEPNRFEKWYSQLKGAIVVPADHMDPDRFRAFHPFVLILEFDTGLGRWVE